MICPACITGAVLLLTGATSGGGLAAVVGEKLAVLRKASQKRMLSPSARVPGQSTKELLHGTETRNAA
jgi:hypothetical protein